MKEISIPLPDFLDKQIAEIEVKINGKKRRFNFKVESFRWEPDDAVWLVEDRIKMLQQRIESYDKTWELIQIFIKKLLIRFNFNFRGYYVKKLFEDYNKKSYKE